MKLFFVLLGFTCAFGITGLSQNRIHVGLLAGPKWSLSEAVVNNNALSYVIRSSTYSGQGFLEYEWLDHGFSIGLGFRSTQHINAFSLDSRYYPSVPRNNFPKERFVYQAWEVPLYLKARFWKNHSGRIGTFLTLGCAFSWGTIRSVLLDANGPDGTLEAFFSGESQTLVFDVRDFRIYPQNYMIETGIGSDYQLTPGTQIFISAGFSTSIRAISDLAIVFEHSNAQQFSNTIQTRSNAAGITLTGGLRFTLFESK
jgi:hypothetical protein